MRTGECDILMCALEGQVGGSNKKTSRTRARYRRGQHGATIHGGGHMVPRGWWHQHGAAWLPPSPALRNLGRRGAPPRVAQPQLTAGEKKKEAPGFHNQKITRPAPTTKNVPGPRSKKKGAPCRAFPCKSGCGVRCPHIVVPESRCGLEHHCIFIALSHVLVFSRRHSHPVDGMTADVRRRPGRPSANPPSSHMGACDAAKSVDGDVQAGLAGHPHNRPPTRCLQPRTTAARRAPSI